MSSPVPSVGLILESERLGIECGPIEPAAEARTIVSASRDDLALTRHYSSNLPRKVRRTEGRRKGQKHRIFPKRRGSIRVAKDNLKEPNETVLQPGQILSLLLWIVHFLQAGKKIREMKCLHQLLAEVSIFLPISIHEFLRRLRTHVKGMDQIVFSTFRRGVDSYEIESTGV